MKKVKEDELRKVLWEEFRVDGWTLFQETSELRRNRIINQMFRRYTNYTLVKGKGLVEMKGKNPDQFFSYHDYSGIYSIHSLSTDINQTIKHSNDRLGRKQRQQFKAKVEKREKRLNKELDAFRKEEEAYKWKVPDAKNQKRLNVLQRKRRLLEKSRQNGQDNER